jgi:hypothetical protein
VGAVGQGLERGIGLATQLKRLALFQQQADNEQQMQDASFIQKMQQLGARSIGEDGMVQDELPIPAGLTGTLGGLAGSRVPITRKAAGGQVVRYKTKDGQSLAFEVPDAREQLANNLRDRGAAQEQDLQFQGKRRKQDRKIDTEARVAEDDALSVPTPPDIAALLGPDAPVKIPRTVLQQMRMLAGVKETTKRTESTNETRKAIAGDTNSTRETVADKNNTSREKIAAGRDTATVAAAGLRGARGSGGRGGAGGVGGAKVSSAEMTRLEAEERGIRSSLAKAAADATKYGEMLRQGAPKSKVAQIQGDLAKAKSLAQSLQEQWRSVVERKKQVAAKGAGSSPAAPVASKRYNPATGRLELVKQ